MSQNPQPPGPWNMFSELIKPIKNQLLLFALATIIAIALLGASVPPIFVALIYIVVITALVVASLPAIRSAFRGKAETPAPPARPVEPTPPARAPTGAREPARLSESEQLRDYLDCITSACGVLRLGGISRDTSDPQVRLAEARNPGSLADVFISLRVDRFRGEPDELARPDRSERSVRSMGEREQLTALEALSSDDARLAVLLGLPGAGKTTVIRYLAFRMAEAYLKPQRLKDTLPEWKADVLLPVIVSLAKLADELPEKPERGLDVRVHQFIQKEVEAKAETLSGFTQRIERESRERGVLFLFDGLDEVAPDKRAVVKQSLVTFLRTRGPSRAIVTCRTFSYTDEAWQLEGWPAMGLAPLSSDDQQQFIDRWYDALIRNDPPSRAMYDEKKKGLIEAISSRDARRLQDISDNPLLLTLITIVHTHRQKLPRSRVLIYQECVELLLWRWQLRRQPDAPLETVLEAMSKAAPEKADSLESLLQRGLYDVAFHAREGQWERHGETTLIDQRSLEGALKPKLGQAATDEFMRYCRTANGLLLSQGSRRLRDRPADEEPVECFAFPHPSFEEYLAARYIASLTQPHVMLAQRNASSDRWFYVGVFLAEYYAILNPRSSDVLALTSELLARRWAKPEDSEGYWRNVWLAGVIWPIFIAEFPDERETQSALEARVVEQLKTLCETGQLPPPQRAAAGRALAALGDPRDAIMRPEQMEFHRVPAGPFLMGSADDDPQAYDDEKPQHEFDIPYDYQIACCPVTNAQFQAFVEAGGYRKQAYWTEAQAAERWKDGKLKWRYYQLDEKKELQVFEGGEAESPYPFSAPFDLPNHPVVGVSWYEALAFTRWLTDEWRKCGKISADEIVRLPTEAEWEKAARGTDKCIYAWEGDQDPTKANVAETGIGSTSAVGIFPTGASPYKCLDMIGNVWEWTQSLWGRDWRKPDFRYPYQNQKEEREDIKVGDDVWRVLRGGAWGGDWYFARAAYRFGGDPDYRGNLFGFRVVVAPNSRS